MRHNWRRWRWVGVALAAMVGVARADDAELERRLKALAEQQRQALQALEQAYQQKLEQVEAKYREELAATNRRLAALEAERAARQTAAAGAQTTATEAGARSFAERGGAAGPAVDQRLAKLELAMTTMQAQQETVLTQLHDRVDFHLYGTLAYEDYADTTSEFNARNVAMVAEAEMTTRLKFMSIVEMEPAPGGGTDVGIDQAWMEYRIDEWVKPRFGIILMPFGRFNMEHFDILNDLASRPLIHRNLIPVSWEEAGLGIAGNGLADELVSWSALQDVEVDYQAYLVNGLTNDLSDTQTMGANGWFDHDNNDNKAGVGRLGLRYAGQEVGLSGYYGTYDSSHGLTGTDVDWRFRYRDAELQGEYAVWWLEPGVEADGVTAAPAWYRGGYLQANYHFWFERLNHTFLGREFDSPTFTAVVRYDELTIADDGDPGGGENREQRLSMGLNYRPTEAWVFKLEYQFNETSNEPLDYGNRDGWIFSVSATF